MYKTQYTLKNTHYTFHNNTTYMYAMYFHYRRNIGEAVVVEYGLSLQQVEVDEEQEVVSALVWENYVRAVIIRMNL